MDWPHPPGACAPKRRTSHGKRRWRFCSGTWRPGKAGVDILVHAAGGLTQYGPMESQSLAGIEAEWRSNFVTAFLVLRAGLPVMKRDGWGRAVLFTSAAVENPKPLMSAYLAAKTAVAALVRVAALEYAGTGVAVNAVAPTILDTGQNRREMGERGASQWVPLERMVKAVLRLADPGTHVESGQIITLV